MGRKLTDWIGGYLEYTEETEPPLGFKLGCAISCISAALERRCWLPFSYRQIFPNTYIILVGPSGASRKGEAMYTARYFMKKANVHIAPQSTNQQTLIARLQRDDSRKQFMGDDKNMVFHCSIACVSEELQVFLGSGNIDFLAALTDWYDCADAWIYETKSGGKQQINGVCFNLLGATAPSWIASMFPKEAIGGGFTSRCILIVEQYKGKIVVNPATLADNKELHDNLVHDIQSIATLKGAFSWSKEALEAYGAWYLKYETAIKNGNPPIHDTRFGGYIARRAAHAMKFSMLMSASRGDDMIITLGDFQRSVKILESFEPRMPHAFKGVGESTLAAAADTVLSILRHAKSGVKRSTILRNNYRDIDGWALDKVIEMFVQAKLITTRTMLEDSDVLYKMRKDKGSEEEV